MTLAFAPERIEMWPLARLQPGSRRSRNAGCAVGALGRLQIGSSLSGGGPGRCQDAGASAAFQDLDGLIQPTDP